MRLGGAQAGVSSQGGQSGSALPSSPSVGWNDWQPVPEEVSWLEADKQKTFPGCQLIMDLQGTSVLAYCYAGPIVYLILLSHGVPGLKGILQLRCLTFNPLSS